MIVQLHLTSERSGVRVIRLARHVDNLRSAPCQIHTGLTLFLKVRSLFHPEETGKKSRKGRKRRAFFLYSAVNGSLGCLLAYVH